MAAYGYRATIGLIVPPRTNETVLYEMMKVVPEGVSWCVSTLCLVEQELEAYRKALDMTEVCAAELVARGVQALTYAGLPPINAQGPRYHEKMTDRMRSVAPPSMPVTTDLGAMLQAMELLGMRRVTVISNYKQEMLDRLVAALNAYDVDVVSSRGIHLSLAQQMTDSSFDTAYDLAMESYKNNPHTDGFFFACPQWPLIGNIDRIESETGLPAITQLQVLSWWVLRELGIPGKVANAGKLLSGE